jgi:hypothetical protein
MTQVGILFGPVAERLRSVAKDYERFGWGAAAAVLLVVGIALLLMWLLGLLGNQKTVAGALTFLGVVVTASVSFVGLLVRRQAEAANDARLRLDAAMRAAELFNGDGGAAAPAAAASGLLALTELKRADLAVALLVDLWDIGRVPVEATALHYYDEEATAALDPQTGCEEREVPQEEFDAWVNEQPTTDSMAGQRISDEVAVLVINAALQSSMPNAELVAAELLCRNAARLDIRQSLHWPSAVDGRWIPTLGNKTKLLVVDALVRMALTSVADQSALQSLAVRLFGISDGDEDENVKGCLGVLINAILPPLKRAGTLMQGPREITLVDLQQAAKQANPNPNRHMARVVCHRAQLLKKWAAECDQVAIRPGALAATAGL